ncbi:MAG: HDOD domain-containing protein [Candidatus Zixiibacteriota bacterium]
MSTITPKELISKIHEIGSLPQSLAAVLKVLNNPVAGADEIAGVISKDVALTTRVLKMVNSAQYSRRHKVSKVSEAVVVMGLNSIKMLTLSSSVFGMIPDKELGEKLDIKRIWRHLIETATSARKIAEATKYRDPEEAFVAGILHDLGIIIMLLYYKEKYLEAVDIMKNDKAGLTAAEKKAFGFTHCEVGAEMINAWKLPPRLAFVVQHHHQFDASGLMPEDSDLNSIISLADRLTLGPFDEYYPELEQNIMFIRSSSSKMNLEIKTVNAIRKDSIHQALQLAEYLDLEVGEIIDILTEANERLAEMYFSLEKIYIDRQNSQGQEKDQLVEVVG